MITTARKVIWIGATAACLLCALPGAAQPDLIRPTLESAASVGGRYIGVRFSERVQAGSAEEEFNYSINHGAVGVMRATLRSDGTSALLELGSVLTGTFSLTVNSVLDLGGLSIAQDTTITGQVWVMGTDVIGAPPGVTSPPGTNFSSKAGDVDVVAGGSDIWDTSDEFHFVYQKRTGDFDVAVNVQRLDAVHDFSKAGLMARESLDGNSKTIQINTNPDSFPGLAQYQAERRPATGGLTISWGTFPGTELPNAWMRLKRSGDIFTGYHGTDGMNWTRYAGPVSQFMAPELWVGMATTSHDITRSTVAEYRKFSDLSSGQLDPALVGLLPLEDQAVGIGETVTFLAEVPGSSGYFFQWHKNGAVLPGAHRSAYVIPTATQADAGTYSVWVRNAYGAVEMSAAVLTVKEADLVLVPFSHVWRYQASGTDLETLWKEPSFVDSAWSSGPGPLGFETTPQVLPIQIQTPILRNNRLTYYFRSTFMFTNDPADVVLDGTTLLDDGAVIYLNGVEFLRPFMGEGMVTFNTPSYLVISDAFLDWRERLSSSLLRRGENHIAVEMHQNSQGSSDMVFALELKANFLAPTELAFATEPQDLVVEALKPAGFEVKVTGNRAGYQWFKDGNAIAGATQPHYTIPNATTADQGNYHVVASNAVNVVRSRNASLNVVVDATPPMVVRADGTLAATTVEVIFSEPVTPLSATNLAHYTITNTMGGTLPIAQATLKNNTTVVLASQARQAQQTYWLLARNVQDRAFPANTLAPGLRTPITSLVPLIAAQTDWLYYDTVVDPPLVGTAWREEVYDTTAWYTLPAAFVLDSDAVPLPLPTQTVLSQGQVTTYFRREFDFSGGAPARLRFRHYVDDGAVFYLNGVEVLRYNMPAGLITDQTWSKTYIGKAWPIETNLPAALLRSGANLMAVELHADYTLDRDLFFALELQVEVDSFPTGPLVMAEPPQNQTALEGQPATFRVVGTGSMQWERNGQAIAGAHQSTYTIPAAHPNMNGSTFTVVLANASGGTLRSPPATLTVVAEHEAPRLLSASAQANIVTLRFSEPVHEASATLKTHYTLRETTGRILQIMSASMGQHPAEVILTAEELTEGLEHRIDVHGVTDQAMAANPVAAGTAATFTPPVFVAGLVKAEFYGADFFIPESLEPYASTPSASLYFQSVFDLTAHLSFPEAPKFVAFKSLWELSRAMDTANDFGARISGFFVPRETGPHIFYLSSDDGGELWLSSDTLSAHKELIAREPIWAGARQWTGTTIPDGSVVRPNRENISAPIQLVAGRKYYMESLMKEGSGWDCMAVAVQQPSDPGPPANGSSPIPSTLLGGYWDNPGANSRIAITRDPAPQTGEVGQRLTLQAGVHLGYSDIPGASTVYYQWQRNGVDIAGATGAFFTTPSLTAADNGAEYRVIVRTADGAAVASGTAMVSVVSANTPVFLETHRSAEGNVVISWERTGFLLQRTDALPGIWESAPTQVSPSVVPASEAQEFFRLIKK